MLFCCVFVFIAALATSGSDTVIETSSTASATSSSSSSSAVATSSTRTVISSDNCSEPKCPVKCRPTCKVPNPKNCIVKPGCTYCGTGKVWNEDKAKCCLISECPNGKGCNGDPNASIRELPPPCPSTCDAPNELPCKKKGLPVGCVCNPGYILSEIDGKCIEPNCCPGGNPCGVNGTFAYCKIDCPSSFCPVDDRRGIVICDPAQNCPSGCICKHKYIWKSKKNRQCILSQECPEIPCTRQNEKWDPCPSPCFSDGCYEYNKPNKTCNTFVEPQCYPQCRCKSGFAREYVNDLCICGEDCPKHPTPQCPQPVPLDSSN